ncbi:hypothetical protein TNIN_400661 [Trichonephila inaurata madagascariensis]|uniref:Uncharacterized protein n=1 Tax=Trichonephila inaurata madagascariensis TaxID=2747483 RepID=A0A8X6XIM6_9ARAC|nr:hypothetical protein TNIN_400661 [Trichonephila inaurata madagascariensis]
MNSEKQMLQTHQKTGCFLSRRVIDTHVTGRPVQVPSIDQWDGRKEIHSSCQVRRVPRELSRSRSFRSSRRLRGSDVGNLFKGGETCGRIPSMVQIYRGDWMVNITCFAFAPKDVWRVAPTADGLLGMCT